MLRVVEWKAGVVLWGKGVVHSVQTRRWICVFREVKVVHVLWVLSAILLHSVKKASKDMDAEHCSEQ